MKSYEGLLILAPDTAPDARNVQNKAIDELVKKYNGKIVRSEFVEKRPLGYKINKIKDAYVRTIDFQMSADMVNEFRKALQLSEAILKYMITVKKEEKVATGAKAKKKAEAPQPVAS